jgi:hypothetical protein
MNAKERFDALMKLVDFRMSRIADRRDHEWKVTVALWALLAAATIYLRPLENAGPCEHRLVAAILSAIVLGHAFLWVGNHWKRSKEDILISFFYSERAHDLALGPLKEKSEALWGKAAPWPHDSDLRLRFLQEPRCWAQIVTTAVLALGVGLKCAGLLVFVKP